MIDMSKYDGYFDAQSSLASALLTKGVFGSTDFKYATMGNEVTGQKWDEDTDTMEDYVYYETEKAPSADGADLLISRVPGQKGQHYPLIDLDVDHLYIPSTQKGHGHLVITKPVPVDTYWKLLDVLVECGIVEKGYAEASKAKNFAAIRLPWVKKSPEQIAKSVAKVKNTYGPSTSPKPVETVASEESQTALGLGPEKFKKYLEVPSMLFLDVSDATSMPTVYAVSVLSYASKYKGGSHYTNFLCHSLPAASLKLKLTHFFGQAVDPERFGVGGLPKHIYVPQVEGLKVYKGFKSHYLEIPSTAVNKKKVYVEWPTDVPISDGAALYCNALPSILTYLPAEVKNPVYTVTSSKTPTIESTVLSALFNKTNVTLSHDLSEVEWLFTKHAAFIGKPIFKKVVGTVAVYYVPTSATKYQGLLGEEFESYGLTDATWTVDTIIQSINKNSAQWTIYMPSNGESSTTTSKTSNFDVEDVVGFSGVLKGQFKAIKFNKPDTDGAPYTFSTYDAVTDTVSEPQDTFPWTYLQNLGGDQKSHGDVSAVFSPTAWDSTDPKWVKTKAKELDATSVYKSSGANGVFYAAISKDPVGVFIWDMYTEPVAQLYGADPVLLNFFKKIPIANYAKGGVVGSNAAAVFKALDDSVKKATVSVDAASDTVVTFAKNALVKKAPDIASKKFLMASKPEKPFVWASLEEAFSYGELNVSKPAFSAYLDISANTTAEANFHTATYVKASEMGTKKLLAGIHVKAYKSSTTAADLYLLTSGEWISVIGQVGKGSEDIGTALVQGKKFPYGEHFYKELFYLKSSGSAETVATSSKSISSSDFKTASDKILSKPKVVAKKKKPTGVTVTSTTASIPKNIQQYAKEGTSIYKGTSSDGMKYYIAFPDGLVTSMYSDGYVAWSSYHTSLYKSLWDVEGVKKLYQVW